MADYAIQWDQTGERLYETGVDHGVLYINGVAWNGLTAVNHSPEGAEANDTYADNIKYLTLRSAENFKFTIEALYSPEEFDACDGTAEPIPGVMVSQQARKMFGFCHRSNVGSDTDGNDHGYKYHLIWGCTADPSEHNYETINDSPEPASLSWEISTVTQDVGTISNVEYKPTAKITIDSTKLDTQGKTNLETLLGILYGTPADPEAQPPVAEVKGCMPSPKDVIAIMSAVG